MMISIWHLLLIFTGTIRKLYARWLTINITHCLLPLRMMDLLLSAMAKFTGTVFQRFVVSTTLKDRGNNNLVWNHFILMSLILPCPPGQTLLSPILNHQPPSLQVFCILNYQGKIATAVSTIFFIGLWSSYGGMTCYFQIINCLYSSILTVAESSRQISSPTCKLIQDWKYSSLQK